MCRKVQEADGRFAELTAAQVERSQEIDQLRQTLQAKEVSHSLLLPPNSQISQGICLSLIARVLELD